MAHRPRRWPSIKSVPVYLHNNSQLKINVILCSFELPLLCNLRQYNYWYIQGPYYRTSYDIS